MAGHEGPEGKVVARLADKLRLRDGLGFQVRVVSARANQLFHDFTGQDAVTPRQYGVLLTLYQRGPLTLSELASAIHVDRSTMTEMARRLQRDGLVTRSSHGQDRRSAVLALSSAGRAVTVQLTPGAARVQDRLLAPLEPGERRQLLRWVKLIADSDAEGDTRE